MSRPFLDILFVCLFVVVHWRHFWALGFTCEHCISRLKVYLKPGPLRDTFYSICYVLFFIVFMAPEQVAQWVHSLKQALKIPRLILMLLQFWVHKSHALVTSHLLSPCTCMGIKYKNDVKLYSSQKIMAT